MIYRQGDVLLVRTLTPLSAEAVPVARNQGRIVLAYGEVTGHAHAIHDALAELFTEKGGRLYLKVEGEVTVQHEEHAGIALPSGVYEVRRQREYHPAEIRNVSD